MVGPQRKKIGYCWAYHSYCHWLLLSEAIEENSKLYNQGTEDLQNNASPGYFFRLKSSIILLVTMTNSKNEKDTITSSYGNSQERQREEDRERECVCVLST